VEVKYYAFNQNNFRERHIRFTRTIQSEYADKYVISEAPQRHLTAFDLLLGSLSASRFA